MHIIVSDAALARVCKRLKEGRCALACHSEALSERVEDEQMRRPYGLSDWHLGLLIGFLELPPPLVVADVVEQVSRRLQRGADVANRLKEQTDVLRTSGARCSSIGAVTLGALSLQCARREKPGGHRVVTCRADWAPAVALLEQLEMPALLKSHELAGMASTAGRGKIGPMHPAGRVPTVQHVLMGRKALECRGIAAVTGFTTNVVSPMRRIFPVSQMHPG